MNKFEIIIQTVQGFLSYIIVRNVNSPKDLWHQLRADCGVEVEQGGWQVWYPHLQINTVRLIGPCAGVDQPDTHAHPNDFPRPSGRLVVKDTEAGDTDTVRLNRIIRWAINTHKGEALLEWVGGRNLRQSDIDVYIEFRNKLDNLGV